ncbi:D-aminoacylase [Sphingobium amiense]|uniref:D-aminoacylase n=1 Tax=Sphingobium amiense TaxID=135719 RepID=A0A494WAI5_9SPHN|nr:D-aminoacylase [Sphingobium amiense]BBD97219.1 D-aminoacylase [Sphingobium amiense]
MHQMIIRNASIIDGSGKDRYRADILIVGDRIGAIGNLADRSEYAGIEQRDAEGLVLCPGFIDAHSHDDNALLRDPGMAPKVTQGVTTVVTGNCGISLAPLVSKSPPSPLDLIAADDPLAFRYETFADYMTALEEKPAAVNTAPMVGHSTLRIAAMTDIDRPATAGEIAEMRRLLREAIEAGAVGFSTGLFYPSSRAAPAEEVVAVLQALEGSQAVYTTHMRDEADEIDASLEESFETARQANVPLIISHHKCMGKRNFGRTTETLKRIERAAQEQDVSFDVYPYEAGSTVLLQDLADKSYRVRLTRSKPHPEMVGRELADVAAEWGVTEHEAMQRLSPGGAVYYMMDQADVDRVLKHDLAMIGSDGMPHDHFPHPRLWGTFPRVLGHYARDRGLFSLEMAIHRMTGLTARKFHLEGRGTISEGAFADLVLLDPEKIIDRATFDDPTAPADGIQAVFVNGEAVLDKGALTAARPGRVLRHAEVRESAVL